MDILSYLSELIQTRKAVGVSGLGTVYKKKLPGRYDAALHSFVPPSYIIDFTPEVKEELILAEFISKKRNVSIDTANYFIDEFSNGILQQLNDVQEASLGDLGKLSKADDELHFVPSEKLNYGFDFYGLPVVKAEQEPSAEEIMPETPPVEEIAHSHIDEVLPFETPVVEDTVVEEVTPIEGDAAHIGIPVVEELAAEQIPTVEEATTPIVEEQLTASQTVAHEEAELAAETPVIVPTGAEQEIISQEHEIIPHEEKVSHEEPTLVHEIDEHENPEEPVVEPVKEPAIETVVPDHENFIPDSPPRKDEQQLRAEIEALNFYRSKSPVAKTTTPEQEEVIWNIKDNTKTTEPAQFYNKNEEVYTPEEEEEKPKTTPLYLKIILSLLILVIMMIVAYIVKPEWFNGLITNNPFNTPKTETPVKQPVQIQERFKSDSSQTTDTLKKAKPVNTPVTATAAAAKPVVKKDTVIKKAEVKKTDGPIVYEIIGASMHDQKEADKFIELMKRSGVDAKVVTNMSGRRLKMSIATLKDEESAKLELERLSKKLKIPGIYIYKNKQ
ncbi:hypothetical protein H7F33_15850 [Pedobacter sp. PAMC26386]|nr:hypothetical protein H7F33_15850 [Pedobacter sp. PAMC26386]